MMTFIHSKFRVYDWEDEREIEKKKKKKERENNKYDE